MSPFAIRVIGGLALAATCGLVAGPGERSVGAAAIQREDYRAFFDAAVARIDAGEATTNLKELLLAARARLFRETGEEKYLEPLVREVRGWIEGARMGRTPYPLGFAGRYPVALALTTAIEHGNLRAGEAQAARDIGAALLVRGTYEGGGWMNRSVGYALGVRPILRLVPNHVLAPELRDYANAIEQNLLHYGEELEDSANYITILLIYTPLWIEDNGLEQLKTDPKIRNFFERALQTVSPTGGIPSYGDYGGHPHSRGSTVAGFEWAARTYRDGRFKWAARRVALAGPMSRNPAEAKAFTGYDLLGIAYAYAWADDAIAEQPLSGSVLTRRNTGALDKLILRGGDAPTDAFVMLDLHNGSEHGDNDALAVVSVIKNGRVALSDQSGRNPANHSKPLVRETMEDFPFPRPGYGLGRWRLASLDLKAHWSFGNFPGGVGSPVQFAGLSGPKPDMHATIGPNAASLPLDFHYNPAGELIFAVKCHGSGSATLYLDEIKLIDKEGRERVLENFEAPTTGWFGRFRRAEAAREGRWCGAVDFDFGHEWPIAAKKFSSSLSIDRDEWERLEFWYKVESPSRDAVVWAAIIGDEKGYPRNYLFHHNPMFPVQPVAFADEKTATYAAFTLEERDDFGRPQTKQREVLFLKRGVLWVRDTIEVKGEGEYAAGTMWHVKNLSGVRNANWFASRDEENLLVYFLPRANQAIGSEVNRRSGRFPVRNPHILHHTATGRAPSVPLIFDSVLIPHSESEDPRALAAQIQVLHDRDGATVLRIGDDLLLLNSSGGRVRAGGIDTDAPWLHISLVTGNPSPPLL